MAEGEDWRGSVTDELRNHLVHKMMQALLLLKNSNISISVLPEQIVSKLKMVENKFYEEANSRSEYYHKIAEKIYAIQKFFEEHKMLLSITQGPAQGPGASEDQMSSLETMMEDLFLN